MVNKIGKDVISFILITSIFITGTAFAQFAFYIYWFTPVYVVFIIYGIFCYRKFNVKVLFGLISLVAYSFLTYKSDLQLVVKQIINIAMFTLVFYYLIAHENYSLERLFRKYVIIAKIILVIGFIQVAAFCLGFGDKFVAIFPFLNQTNISYRFQSLSEEPSMIGLTFGPIVFLALHNVFYKTNFFISKIWGWLFIAAYVLTLASTCFVTLILMLLVLYLKDFTRLKAALFFGFAGGIVAFSIVAYYQIPLIKVRVDDTVYALKEDFKNPDVYTHVNLSTYAIISNFIVTKTSIAENPLFGRGLGTHEASYQEYLPAHMKEYYQLNAKDANSMALRLLSETGLVGFFAFLYFVAHFYQRSRRSFDQSQTFMWVLNAGIAVIIASALLRHGNYTSSGKVLFLLMYYYSYRYIESTSRRETPESSNNISVAV